MATKLDIVEGHSLIEEFGYVTELVRRAYVNGLVAATHGQLYAALADLGLPVPGDAHPSDANLILGQRVPSPAGVGKAFVDLVYRTKRPILRGGSAVSQITSMINPKTNAAITVSYTKFGKIGGVKDSRARSEKQTQGVEVTGFSAEHTIFGEFIGQSSAPGTDVEGYVNKLNSATWQGLAAGRVLCMRGDYEPYVLTSATPWYRFMYEFQVRKLYTYTGSTTNAWNPEAVYIRYDGRPPEDVDKATNDGITLVDWHNTVDFNALFP